MKIEAINKFKLPENIDITGFYNKKINFLEFLATTNVNVSSLWNNQYLLHKNFYDEMAKDNKNIFSNIETHNLFLESWFDIDFDLIKPIKFNSVNFIESRKNVPKHNEKILEACENASKILPKKYNKIYKEYNLFFGEYQYSYIDPKNKKIFIKLHENNDLLKITHDYVHELGHIIEYTYKNKIIKHNMEFLKKRIFSNEKNEYTKTISSTEARYYNNLINEYAGTIYIDSIYNANHNDPYTEILSFGIGLLYYNPIAFYYEDPHYFLYILNYLKD